MEPAEMYEVLKKDLVRFARSIARHEQEAYDLIQDALEKSLRSEMLLSLPVHKQRAWFYRVMKNRLIDDRRKEKRLSAWEEETDFPVRELVGDSIEMAKTSIRQSRSFLNRA